MNGSNGITPTVELATTNGAYPYPVMYGGNSGFGGFGSDGALWLIVLLALIWGGNGNNGFGGFGGRGFDESYAWLSNGQKEIMSNTNNGFDTLHLSNQLEGTRDGINALSNQLCNSISDITSAVANGFYGLNTSLLNCCCENRLGIANLSADIAREACATRANDTQNTQSILNVVNGGIQSIKDQLCQDKIDAKNDEIAQLRQEVLYARGQASQVAQTAELRLGQEREIDAMYQRLKDCPVGTVPVYGNQPIFSYPNNGCGCGFNTTSQFI